MIHKNRDGKRRDAMASRQSEKERKMRSPRGNSSYAMKKKRKLAAEEPLPAPRLAEEQDERVVYTRYNFSSPPLNPDPTPIFTPRSIVKRVKLPNSGREADVIIANGKVTFL